LKVIGVDPVQEKVDMLNRGESYVMDVPSKPSPGWCAKAAWRPPRFFCAGKADAVSICVPTPLRKTGDPDLSYILNATEDLAKYVHPGMIVVLESTTYPGTTRELILPEADQGWKV
jgi:UDP-N-acetyl-D-glucosamine dehydrogenase